ncbi:GLOBIN domain-containing protein [Mycena venus]|uniref:GLOBIN domain-containing protein n=1 Tax=Mycena venus TaxID=2733690 RepID=A0A8H6X7K2_9AGAR|nr:GLOBIN domain-containing protein [Mycena venus]
MGIDGGHTTGVNGGGGGSVGEGRVMCPGRLTAPVGTATPRVLPTPSPLPPDHRSSALGIFRARRPHRQRCECCSSLASSRDALALASILLELPIVIFSLQQEPVHTRIRALGGAQQLVAADAAAAEAATAAYVAQHTIPLENLQDDNNPRASSPAAAPPSPLPPYPSGRPQRRRQPPKRFRDEPPALPSIVEPPEIPDVPAAAPDESGTELRPQRWVKTEPNRFGLYKVFPNRPTHDPDESISLDDLCKSPELLVAPKVPSSSPSTPPWYPFLNSTVARLMSWFHLGSNLKSIAELDSLVDDVLLKDDFNQEHLRNFKAARENKRMDDANGENSQDGWQTASVKIKLPAHNVCVPEADAAEFEVEGLLYRPLLDVMKEAFQSPAFEQFHITPFQYRWDPHYNPDDPDISLDPRDALDEDGLPQLPNEHQKVYGEIYTSDPMLRAHNKLRMTTPHLETVIAAYMFWSDSTHLANFGNASLWPLYTFFGNLSKYIRAKPTANAAYHQAYFPSVRLTFYFCFAVSHDFQLPDSLKDFYREKFGSSPSLDMWAHLKRELMHAIWDLLISEEFIHAYINGIVIKCYDGVERLVFPRFFTYGADYPEKVLLATIKYFGGCPCPRCFIEKDKIPEMGTKADMRRRQNTRQDTTWYRFIINLVRRWIFERGFLVAGAAVARNLKQYSWVPTRNAFSKLAAHSFNFYSMFVPDLLHEVELGGWKSLFAHLVRILQAEGEHLIDELDARFRKMPTFGRSTIRRFHANVSEMKKMAARDFEDILQCCFAVFEGLLPEPHNTIILTLIYVFATWHAYAKLRMHTDSSVTSFRAVTRELGAQARHFLRTTCHRYTTYELPSEYNRRARRHAQKNAKSGSTATPSKLSKERKTWNICTYKWHSLGDYADAIVHVGTHDSYSTLTGELAHRRVKKFYAKTNKHNFVFQIGAHEHRRRLTLQVKKSIDAAGTSKDAATEPAPHIEAPANQHAASIANIHTLLASENDKLPPSTPPKQHHHISESKRTFLQTYELPKNDTATKDFLPNLKAHLLNRLLEKPYDGDETQYSLQELADVNIIGERLYTHKVMRINFTTYDCLRDSDTLNPRTRPDFIVQAHEDEDEAATHPYWYGRIIGIFHASVRHVGPLSKNRTKVHWMEFLWVRWFGRDLSHPGGWKYKRLKPKYLQLGCHLTHFFSRETKTPLDKLLSMAKYFPRAVHPFLDIGLALHYGAATHWTVAVSSDPSNTITLPEECVLRERVAQKQLVNAFETMVLISIESVDVLREFYKEERQWGLIVRKFRKAAADARQSDTHNLKHKLQYLPSDPTKPITPAISNGELKSDRGRRRGEEAELTPAAIKALKALLNGGLTTRGKPAMKAKSWPSCFYADGAYDSNDPQAGLFRSLFLLRVARHLWTAPSSAMDGAERIKAICVARAHGQYRFTKEMLGYGRTMLSTSDWTSRDGKYNYEDLFDNVLELFEDPTDTWAIETLGWFQKGVFGGAKVSGSDNGDNNDDSDDSDSEMATIRARRRAARSSESSSESG